MLILLAGMLILSLFKSSSSVDDLGELEFEPTYNYLFIFKSSSEEESEDYLFKIIFFYLSLPYAVPRRAIHFYSFFYWNIGSPV